MIASTLVPEDLDPARCAQVVEFVNCTSDLVVAVDAPSTAAHDLMQRLGSLRDKAAFESVSGIAAVASGPYEFETVVCAALVGRLSRIRHRPGLATRQVGLDLVLVEPGADAIHILNPTGASIWYHLTPDRTLRAIIDALAMSFPKSDTTSMVRDVVVFLEELRRLDLLVDMDEPLRAGDPSFREFVIPDTHISALDEGYIVPAVKSFSFAELERQFDVDGEPVVVFEDTWDPDAQARSAQIDWTSRYGNRDADPSGQ